MARPTLVSLAQQLGVSRQTVSNVINSPHLVKPETRERVQAAITASGYRPNVAAQALRNRRSRTFAVRVDRSVDGINGAILDRYLHNLVQTARGGGYNVMLITASSDQDEVDQLVELFERGWIDAALFTNTHHGDERAAQLAERNIPVAAFGRPWGGDDSAHLWTDVDGAAGTRMATEHLLGLGLRRIGFVGCPRGVEWSDDRRAGWVDAMAGALGASDGQEWPGWQELREDGVGNGLDAVETLLERGVEGVVCASDSLALGGMEALRRAGVDTVAGYLPVVGFDDTPVAQAVGLSSISQPVERCAELLAQALIATLEGETDAPLPLGDRLQTPSLVARLDNRPGRAGA